MRSPERPSSNAGIALAPAATLALAALSFVSLFFVAPALLSAPEPEGDLQAAPEADAEFSAEVSVGYVLVPVTVRGERGFVDGLLEEDFEVTVDGRPVVIDSFSLETDAPIDLLVLQDLSGSMALSGKVLYSRRLLHCLVKDPQGHDSFGLAAFGNGRFWVAAPPQSTAEAVLEAASSYDAVGTTALHDAVSWIPELGRMGGGRRATVIVTDGVDNASRVSPEAARLLLEDAAMPIYTVDLHSARDAERFVDEFDSEEIEGLLRGFARVSGGRYIKAIPSGPAEPVCRAIRDDLRRHYLIGFATGGTRSRRQHDIEVRVAGRKGRKVALNFRRSYVGGDPAAPGSS